jgi:DNA/RNA-binding domain of Phe-tRNA-synthetase-like protein
VSEPPSIAISPELAGALRLGVVRFAGLTVASADASLEAALAAAEAEARARYGRSTWAEIPGLRDVRASYHRMGVDPTKRRPSSEALLRRVVGGKPLPRISNLVDCINLFSLRHLVPIGLYDAARIIGPVVLRHGRPGEVYEAIGREAFGIVGRPVLADAQGPFGSPTSDALRTMVTPATRDALAVLFWPPERPGLAAAVAELGALVVRHCGGRVAAACS